ncbi:class I SAM-dependent methyltransferase [uncultured Microbacterium sp.]|uniref:class I SAM-dependent methyltransferase n=1 Tax=uncultured Microbacterium sp. TaxID=191216 RepID=UPI0025CB84F9|nr:class I SAM-dependent methyltransferase [uncultured Microbacterium sp.]
MVDLRLAASFRRIGEEYDLRRPGFPEEAAAEVLPGPVGSVLDLGAGTGKFTELLIDRADRVIAVEPSDPMRAVLMRKLPAVDARDGSAEEIPLRAASVDAVVAAQAFHWFDRERACAEIRRVLVPQGVLGLVWNRSVPDCTWDRACSRIAHPALEPGPSALDGPSEHLPGFEGPRVVHVPWFESIGRDEYIARWLTVSSFLAADPLESARMVALIEDVLDTDPATAGRSRFTLPQVTEVFVYRSL